LLIFAFALEAYSKSSGTFMLISLLVVAPVAVQTAEVIQEVEHLVRRHVAALIEVFV